VFVVSIGFALIPAAVISFILNEREKNLKHMQLISGLNLSAYWVSNLIFDMVKGTIPAAIVIGLMYAFELQYDNVWILFLIFPFGVIPFTYVSSFLFTSENIAQTVTIFMHFVIAGIGAIVAGILRIIPSTYEVGDILVWVLKILPSYNLTNSIMYASMKNQLGLVRPELKMDDMDLDAIGGDVLLNCIHGIFWIIILILIEARALRWVDRLFNCCRGKRVPPRTDLVLDEDVLEEEKRVERTPKDQLKVRVDKFRKGYERLFKPMYLAVERTSFGLDYGECFALLGVNGAGKTTTFKSLTGEITPTSGEISINGMDIERDFA
jgi:ATP-binding cassette subfamily A (ABC1) protein 3